MATLTTMMIDSDSEDEEYVPEAGEDGSDSDTGPSSKRQKTEADTSATEETRKEARDSAWASFQASLNISSASSSVSPTAVSSAATIPQKMITIERKYRFAGEEVSQQVEVPEDSLEAQKWLAQQTKSSSSTPPSVSSIPVTSALLNSGPTEINSNTPNPSQPVSTPAPLPSIYSPTVKSEASSASPNPPPPKVKRKSGGLSSLVKSSKPKKLTTLEKSKLDWQAHVASSEAVEQHELEANRREGVGYLDKVAFLGRVDERLEERTSGGSKRKR